MMCIKYFKLLPCVAFTGAMFLTLASNGYTASISIPASEVYRRLEDFHGHVCAGSLFGTRLGFAAKEALTRAGGTGKFTAKYYDLSCPVDGVQVGAGTTYGNGAVAVTDADEHRLVLTAEGNWKKVEVRLTKRAEEAGFRSHTMQKRMKTLLSGNPERLQLERELKVIFDWMKHAPEAEIVFIKVLSTEVKRNVSTADVQLKEP